MTSGENDNDTFWRETALEREIFCLAVNSGQAVGTPTMIAHCLQSDSHDDSLQNGSSRKLKSSKDINTELARCCMVI
jgi:hypothetical protein